MQGSVRVHGRAGELGVEEPEFVLDGDLRLPTLDGVHRARGEARDVVQRTGLTYGRRRNKIVDDGRPRRKKNAGGSGK